VTLSLTQAQAIVSGALAFAEKNAMKPVSIIVLDARGVLKAGAAQDGTSLRRSDIATGKAHGAIALGMGSRSLFKRAKEQAFFIAAATSAIGGSLVPVPGGVLIRDGAGSVLGAVGISGCTSENDEAAAMAGIAKAGLAGDPGTD
jgi:uncharacterized protein GlcG (DUF336 family)